MSDQEPKSRSQLKREFQELKELGKRLCELAQGPLRRLPLSEELRTAVLASRSMKRAALQRQYKFITSLLANDDADAIRAALKRSVRPQAEDLAAFHEIELWRDRLLADEEGALAAFIEQYPACDRSRLGQLLRNARKEHGLDQPPKSARKLFRYLKELT